MRVTFSGSVPIPPAVAMPWLKALRFIVFTPTGFMVYYMGAGLFYELVHLIFPRSPLDRTYTLSGVVVVIFLAITVPIAAIEWHRVGRWLWKQIIYYAMKSLIISMLLLYGAEVDAG